MTGTSPLRSSLSDRPAGRDSKPTSLSLHWRLDDRVGQFSLLRPHVPTDRQLDRQTDRQKDRETNVQIDSHTGT